MSAKRPVAPPPNLAQILEWVTSAGDAELANWLRGFFTPTPPVTPTNPTTPAGLAATAANPVVLTLATPSTDPVAVSGYQIWRGASSGTETLLTMTGSFPYTDSSVAPSTTYFYKVRAFDPAGLFSAFSNEVSAAVPSSGLGPDTTPPLTPGAAPTQVSVGTTTASISCPLVADSTVNSGTQFVTGMQDYLVYVGGVLQGSPVLQPSNALTFPAHGQDIGSPTVAGSDTSVAGVYTLQCGGNAGIGGSSADQMRFLPASYQGDFDISFRIVSVTGGNIYSRGGMMARFGLDPLAAFFAIELFQTAGALGVDAIARLVAGQVAVASSKSSVGPYARFTRTGKTFNAYQSTSNGSWGSPTFTQQIVGTDPVLIGPWGTADDFNTPQTLSCQVIVDTVTVNAVTSVEFDDTFTGSASPSARVYTYAGRDNAGNVGVKSPGVSITPTATGTHIKFNPGQYMSSGVLSTKGNSGGFNGNKVFETQALHASPAKALGKEEYYFMKVFEDVTLGVYDFSMLDADYIAITGYQSGSLGSALYTDPRRMGMFFYTTDFFSANATDRCTPLYIASNPGTYSAGSGAGNQGGSWTTTGQQGPATGMTLKMWHAPVVNRVIACLQAIAAHVLPDGYTVDTSPLFESIKLLGESADTPQGANDPTYSEANYIAQLESLMGATLTAFPHTSVSLSFNYTNIASTAQSIMTYMAANGVGLSGPDIFGYSSGQNIVVGQGLAGLVFGQMLDLGLLPFSGDNGYNHVWVSGGTDTRLVIPSIATIQGTEQIASYGHYYTPPDLFKQADTTLKSTHLFWTYNNGWTGTDATANWWGRASGAAQWNSAPGTWGGVMDQIYNSTLANSAVPTAARYQ